MIPVHSVDEITILVSFEFISLIIRKNSFLNLMSTAIIVPRCRKIENENASTGGIPSQPIMASIVWPLLLAATTQ